MPSSTCKMEFLKRAVLRALAEIREKETDILIWYSLSNCDTIRNGLPESTICSSINQI